MFSTLKSFMPSIPATVFRPVQLGLSLVLIMMGVLFGAEVLGLGANTRALQQASRTAMTESLAVQLSVFASVGDKQSIDSTVSHFVARSEEVRAASLILTSGDVLSRHGEREALKEGRSASTLTHLFLPILNSGKQWGEVQVVFVTGAGTTQQMKWFAFIAGCTFVSFSLFLGKILTQLDPGRVVPARVETAFDLFSAGVIILDKSKRIVLANQAVADIVGTPARELTGLTMDGWPWKEGDDWQAPWATTLHSGLAISDMPLRLDDATGVERLFSLSCAAVGTETDTRGVLITLDDLTPLEHRNRELSEALLELQRSKESIILQNEELEKLATTDPLTGIANRRTLMSRLDIALENALSDSTSLSCIMSDIDFFKRVNDEYGHGVGDDVIKAVAEILKASARDVDTVGRYGGEEFVMILPGLDAQEAAAVAEHARVAVMAAASGSKLAVSTLSSSFGVADLTCNPEFGSVLVDAADQALYAAKQGGRNRVEKFGEYKVAHQPSENLEVVAERSNEDIMRARVIELETLLIERDNSLENSGNFDNLTGVPMRTVFQQRVETELARSKRSGTFVGVMSFELRELDRITNSFGHTASDALVVEFVERLQTGLRTTDIVSWLTAEHSLSRITFNEYGVLLSDLIETSSAMIVVTRLKRLLSKPFHVAGEQVYVGANIGISVSSADIEDASTMFVKAGEARLLAASKPEKVSHGFASAALDDESHDYIRMESDLHRALDKGDLQIWFQPKFDLAKRRITGMEALLRWHHETRGFVSPAVFVAVAEANGMIGRLSTFVLEGTLKQICLWREMGFDELCVSINVSPMQLRAESLVSDTLAALEASGVSGHQLEIELTETSVLDRPEEARVALEELRAKGIGISMDDFGAGYTSLALLAELPLDTVKIDRSFVSAMAGSMRSRAVVQSIINLAHALNLRVVGEGVETNEELEILAQFGCDEVQGYLISRPQPADDITAFLVHQRASEKSRRQA